MTEDFDFHEPNYKKLSDYQDTKKEMQEAEWANISNKGLEQRDSRFRVAETDEIRNGWDTFFRIAFFILLFGSIGIFLFLGYTDHFKSSYSDNSTVNCNNICPDIPSCPSCVCPQNVYNFSCQPQIKVIYGNST